MGPCRCDGASFSSALASSLSLSLCLSLSLTAWSLWLLCSQQKEEAQREQGAKYSAETGRLIPTSTQATGRRHHSRQGPRIYPSGKDGGVETFTLQDQELLVRPWEGWGLQAQPRPRLEG